MVIRNKIRFCLLMLLLFGVLLFLGGSLIPMPEAVYANDTTYGWHSILQNFGMGIIALIGGLLVFIVHYKVRKLADLKTVKTPGKWATVLIANMAVLLLMLSCITPSEVGGGITLPVQILSGFLCSCSFIPLFCY